MFPLLFLSAAGLASSVLLSRLVAAQRPLIGMLRASGASRRQILGHYLGFGALLGLGGGVIGAPLGVLLGSGMTGLYTRELSIPVSIVRLSPWTPLAGIAFSVVAALLATAAAAWHASRTPPAEAMRRFAPSGGGRLSVAERVLPPLRRAPVRWRMALRGIERSPRRSLSTALGVVLSLTLVMASWGMIDTVDLLAHRQFEVINRQDAELGYASPVDASRLARVRAVPGVARAESAARLPATVLAPAGRYGTSIVALPERTRMHRFELDGGGNAHLVTGDVLLGSALRGRLGLRVGDRVRLDPGGAAPFAARVAGFLDEPLGTYAYVSLETLRRQVPGATANTILVGYAPGADRGRTSRALRSLPGVVAFSDARALLDLFRQYLGLFYAFVGIMLVFGAAMAFGLLFSAMSASIGERSVEMATLRAAGVRQRELSRLITGENAVVVLLATVPGLAVGYEAAREFMGSFSADWYSFALQMRPTTPLLAAAAIVLVALLSQLPGLRAVRRLEVAQVVRERSL